MKKLKYTILLFLLLFSVSAFSQKKSFNDFYINSIDSLINKQLKFQKENRNSEAFVFLKDSMISYHYDDVGEPCENQPTKSYYTYDEYGYVTSLIVKNTPEAGCDASKSKRLYTYDNHNLIDWLFQNYDFDLNKWIDSSKTTYQYDENDNVIEQISFNWNIGTSKWDNYSKLTYLYDANLEIERKHFSWDTSINDWFWNSSYTNSYDNNNNLLEYIFNRWDSNINDWRTLKKITNTYDVNTNLIENINYRKYSNEYHYEWNTIDKTNYTFDASNFIIEEFTFRDWNNSQGEWDIKKKYEYINDTNNNPTETKVYLWDESGNLWLNESLINNTYNSNNDVLVRINQIWESNSWINFGKETNTFNIAFQLTEKFSQLWNSPSNEWRNYSLITITYNEFYNITGRTRQIWDTDYWYIDSEWTYEYDEFQNMIRNHGWAMYDAWDIYNYYSEYDIILSIGNDVLLNNYSIIPNPSSDYILISGLEQKAKILFYDVLGKKVLETNSENKIDISNFRNGLYFVKIIIGDSIIFKKFLKN